MSVKTKLLTNQSRKSFYEVFKTKIKKADELIIACGFFGKDALEEFEDDILKVASRGRCKLLFGMHFHGGNSKKSIKFLNSLHKKLKKTSKNNGIYISRVQYHGKIYKFGKNHKEYYLGSSNFSGAGLKSRLEANSKITDSETQKEIENYLSSLFDKADIAKTLPLDQIQLPVSQKKRLKKAKKTLKNCLIPNTSYPSKKKVLGTAKIELRPNEQPASSLNLYFDAGRLVQRTRTYAPRPWYEIEITARKSETQQRYYPKSNVRKAGSKSRSGEFTGYIEDDNKFYKINMGVYSDHGKAIASLNSSGGRAVLGELIKGRLERQTLIKEGDKITQEILDESGFQYLILKKIGAKEYIMELS